MRQRLSYFPLLLIATVVLVGLQALGVIHWAWYWLLSPLWLPLVAFSLLQGLAVVIVLLSPRKKPTAPPMTREEWWAEEARRMKEQDDWRREALARDGRCTALDATTYTYCGAVLDEQGKCPRNDSHFLPDDDDD